MLIQRPKGTQDIFDQAVRWQQLEAAVRSVLEAACYQEIRTPVFEHTELFLRGVGETTDIVNKEMYTFEKGDRSLTLRPEGTAGVVRAYLENGLSRVAKPVRLYYFGPMFRYERPQAGRQRQFHQVGLEQFGLDTPASDVEALHLAVTLLEKLGLSGLRLDLNNLGTTADREAFKSALLERLRPEFNHLCETCQTRFEANPLRMLDCKNPSCQAIYKGPVLADLLASEYASPESQTHFETVCHMLDDLGIRWQRNRQLVRGLDYYTGLVFEIVAEGQIGAQNVVCGGGRYNGLVSQLGGTETPAVGWAFGIERLLSLTNTAPLKAPQVYLVTDQPAQAFTLAAELRSQGISVHQDLTGKVFGKQLQSAGKSGAVWAIILGETEVQTQMVQLKNLSSGEQHSTSKDELIQLLSIC